MVPDRIVLALLAAAVAAAIGVGLMLATGASWPAALLTGLPWGAGAFLVCVVRRP
ncbi:hypothetical protein Pta02_77660 [Planobispora takensis]|uniref:Uncharacterized protein n=2 Tax=Planobispora TaxID=29298 RepID=A0A8J3T4V4_9ACTN|nr:hypothetical protein Psi01_85380 [Planobispora siamensis]GII05758.1 hypothetical protein Pta02_77660 [Planobispora takensis]